MDILYKILIGFVVVLAIMLVVSIFRKKKLGGFITNAVVGLLAFYFLHKFGQGYLYIPFNIWTVAASGLLGIPGVVLIIVLNIIF